MFFSKDAVVVHCYMPTDKVDNEIDIAHITDLHVDYRGGSFWEFENLDVMAKVLDKNKFDILVVSGDSVDDVSALNNDKFTNRFVRAMSDVMKDVPSIITPGNHCGMFRGPNGWLKGSTEGVEYAYSQIPKTNFLQGLDSVYFGDREFATAMGIAPINIRFVGSSMPFEYYEREKESLEAFKKYWLAQRAAACGKEISFNKDEFNFLIEHAGRNYVQASRDAGKALLLPGEVSPDSVLSGHEHNQLVPIWVPGHRGIYSPQGIKESLANRKCHEDCRGFMRLDDTVFHIGGAVNITTSSNKVVKSCIDVASKVIGAPYICIIHLIPQEKGKHCGPVRIRRDGVKIR